jgi:hypothetical protein
MRNIERYTISAELAQEIFDKATEFNFDYDVMFKSNVGFDYEAVRFTEQEHKKALTTKTSEFLDVSKIDFPVEPEPDFSEI